MNTYCLSLMSELDCWPLQIKFVWDVKLKLPFILVLCVSIGISRYALTTPLLVLKYKLGFYSR